MDSPVTVIISESELQDHTESEPSESGPSSNSVTRNNRVFWFYNLFHNSMFSDVRKLNSLWNGIDGYVETDENNHVTRYSIEDGEIFFVSTS